ncbi:putative nucleoside-diphosphate sugar epimerase [Saccharomonospora marina XMU15]|uniref:Putative nucleoside-diphosphate sugar epimerase n=1 Tax=Saccharomonospora marina XMU15 TaxID=882083 RepID=H5X0T8_9PSEU|nr:SDR family oxidoreductase [Saccharomonospora marina]EHR51938.1 putative nucleoside-diphosphate sugar epimerase [Saccharomonospora marina XMU15]
MSSILVTGGTGTLGRHVVRHLLDGGHDVTVASRRQPSTTGPVRTVRVDYVGGTGLDEAVAGRDAVVHCATDFRGEERLAGSVVSAARRRGCGHVVYISIVGVDALPISYYRGKLAAERLLAASGVGWTVLRSTQFHDLVARILSTLARSPLLPVPAGVRVQPVHAPEVASRLAELACGEPAGRVGDMGGPEIRPFADLARAYLRATGRRRALLPFRLPGAAFRGYREGLHLAPADAVGTVTFERFLSGR